MIISLNWLKKYTDIQMPVDELATLIGARLVEIEKVIDLGAKYKDVLVVKAVSVEKLEGSDHLNVVMIDDGGKSIDVNRDSNGLVQVVCGAPNIRAGQIVVWLRPGIIVPNTFYGYKPLVLEARKLQGVVSNGMIASARELDLFDEHEGILVLDTEFTPGTPFTETYDLNDILLDIENKSLTHRPDCFGIVGIAREVAAVLGNAFETPDWLINLTPDFGNVSDGVAINVKIDNPELSSRYQAIVVSGADGKRQSPLQIQTYLARVGVRPINAVVDVTNYLMMLTGQPLHAFDYDKLVAVGGDVADIHVRASRDGEKLELLDGKTVTLTTGDIVIAAGDTAIALAGAMGGASTAIDETTKNIVIESATFNLFNLRTTQMRHGITSEAITRFTKGQPLQLTAPVLAEAVRLMGEWSGAKVVSQVADDYPKQSDPLSIEFSADDINKILGSDFTADQMVKTLQNVEFTVEKLGEKIVATAPYWRADIHMVEDIVEEIGRINGFDNINPTLPTRDFTAVKPSDLDEFKSQVRQFLVRGGVNEVLSYSFIHGDTIQKSGQNTDNSYKVVNSISPNLQYYRQSLMPSLLDIVHLNIKSGYDSFALFEMNKTHSKLGGINDENVPIESDSLALVMASKNDQLGAPYYNVKRTLDYMMKKLGIDVNYEPIDSGSNDPVIAPFENKRSAKVIDTDSGVEIGVIGEYKKSVAKGFKLPNQTAGFEIDMAKLNDISGKLGQNYRPLSRFPSLDRDICFKIQQNTAYSKIIDAIDKVEKPTGLELLVSPVDIYQSEGCDTKNITVRVKLTSSDHTLTSDEANVTVESLIAAVSSATGAEVV